MAGLQEQQHVSSSQCSKASSAWEHFYSLSVISYTSLSLCMVIYLLPSLCLKHLTQNKGAEREMGEGYPASTWLWAVKRCMCCGLYFWQAFRYRGFLPAIPHAVRSISLITDTSLIQGNLLATSVGIWGNTSAFPAAGCSAIATWSCL